MLLWILAWLCHSPKQVWEKKKKKSVKSCDKSDHKQYLHVNLVEAVIPSFQTVRPFSGGQIMSSSVSWTSPVIHCHCHVSVRGDGASLSGHLVPSTLSLDGLKTPTPCDSAPHLITHMLMFFWIQMYVFAHPSVYHCCFSSIAIG